MAKVIVKNNDLALALKKFSHITFETKKNFKKHEYYIRPGLKAKEKSKNAARNKIKRKAK